MDEAESAESKQSNTKAGKILCLVLLLYITLLVSSTISIACTWTYSSIYDAPEASAAASLISIALCGATFGCCGCRSGGSFAKLGLQWLLECFKVCGDDNELCVLCKLLAACGLALIIVPSFGILQGASGAVMVGSLVMNTAIHMKVFAGFIAALDFLAAICALIFACITCSACIADEE